MALLAQGSTQQDGKITKSWDFFHNRRFCRFIFKNQWGLCGGDLKGFYQSFIKVISKS
jgi:hypothetical protein